MSEKDKFSPCSEYEIYLNWVIARHPHEVRLRSLVSLNSGRRRQLATFQRQAKYDWVAFHSYLVLQDAKKNPQGCPAAEAEAKPGLAAAASNEKDGGDDDECRDGECSIERSLEFI